jgi:hypothetical protein
MTLGRAPMHEDLFLSTRELCESRLPERSIFRLLASRSHELFADDIHERHLDARVRAAAELLATVLGQDLVQREDGVFAIARGVAKDRVISTVDPEARHGHKTAAHGFDGYKGHVSIDPDSELIVATDVTAGNVADAVPAAAMLGEALHTGKQAADDAVVEVYGDSSYGTAALVEHIEDAGAEANVKVQPPAAARGRFAQDAFIIDTDKKTVTCPAGILVELRPQKDGSSTTKFAASCAGCSLRAQCTDSPRGRVSQPQSTSRASPCSPTLADRERTQRASPFSHSRTRSRRWFPSRPSDGCVLSRARTGTAFRP